MKAGANLAQQEIQRMVTCAGTVNISPLIRGERLQGDDVLLTLADGGILVSPYREGGTREQEFSARAKFSGARLYLPVRLLTAANIKRWVTIKKNQHGNLLLTPGERCMICGSRENLYTFNADQQICRKCLEKTKQFKAGG
jgi:hypothetical protein